MARSLREQLHSFGLGSENARKANSTSEYSIKTIRDAPAPASVADDPGSSKHKCEVGGWVPQELLTFGSDRNDPVRYRPIVLWRERDYRWVVFPGSSKQKPKSKCFPPNDPNRALFYFVKRSNWHLFDDSQPYNFSKNSYFSRRYETIQLICFDPIGRLKDKAGIQYRQWARKAVPRADCTYHSKLGEFKA